MRKLFTALATILPFSFSFGQAPENIVSTPQIFPSTPQSQIFENYINHAVTEYNGLPEISIPLYTIEVKGLKIPIALTYHAGGIKYKEYDGEIAAGWSINAGGFRVSRTIFGKPDELFSFYNSTTLNNHLQSGNVHISDAYLAAIGLNQANDIKRQITNLPDLDGEVDQFNYMIPGHNGRFVISNRAAKIVDMANSHQDKIILDENSNSLPLNDVKIVDNSGFKYLMGGYQNGVLLVEKSRASYDNYKTSWMLSKIESPFNETIDFKYDMYNVLMDPNNYYQYKINDAPQVRTYFPQDGDGPFSTNVQTNDPEEVFDIVEKMYFIKEIITEKEKIEFVRSLNSQVLNSIKITNLLNGEQIIITLSYVTSEPHRLLEGIAVNGRPYTFEYYDAPPNVYNSYPDQWGYYKYPYSGGSYWDLFLHEEFKSDQFIESYSSLGLQTSAETIGANLNYLHPQWIDRKSNTNPHYFSLKKIIFPTGGSTTYEYEPNQYRESHTNDPLAPLITGCGQRIRKITSRASQSQHPQSTLFKYGDNEDGCGKIDWEFFSAIHKQFYNEIFSISLTGGSNPGYKQYSLQPVRTYSTKPIEYDMRFNDPIGYKKVAVYQYDEAQVQSNGKYVSTYDFPDRYFVTSVTEPSLLLVGAPENDPLHRTISGYYLGMTPSLSRKEFFDKNNVMLRKEEYAYNMVSSALFEGVKVTQKIFFNSYPATMQDWWEEDHYDKFVNSYFRRINTSTRLYDKILSSKIVTEYSGTNSIINSESYVFNSRNQIASVTTLNSKGENQVTEYVYPTNSAGAVYGQMENLNIISPVISQIKTNNNLEILRVKTSYTNDPAVTTGLFLPSSIETSYSGVANLKTEGTFEKYDTRGNLLQYTGGNGITSSYIWGYYQKFPIAGAIQAKVKDIFFTSFEDSDGNSSQGDSKTGLKSRIGGYSKTLVGISNGSYNLSYWKKQGVLWSLQLSTINVSGGTYAINIPGQIDELRFYPSGAQFTSYTYNPAKGVTSISDKTNRIVYYEYDIYGRLALVRDQDGNIVKKICYNYSGQPESCSLDGNPQWLSTGNIRCQSCPSNSVYISNLQEHEEYDNNRNSPTYKLTRWVVDGVSGNCLPQSDWQNTASAMRCKNVGGINTGEREREQQDMNPCSPTGGQIRWIVVDQNCAVCPRPESWQATGSYRCVTIAGVNTGEQEREERNIETCSNTYNQTRWVSVGISCVSCQKPENWQPTGSVRCVVSGGVNTSALEREERNVEGCSGTYNQTRWVDAGTNCATCPKPVNWQATGNYRCVTSGGFNTGEREREERNTEPCSDTYNETRWVSVGTDCASCQKMPNWQSTGNYRCVTVGGVNTSEREREERDVESCSGTYNQTRWISVGTNCTSCPKPANWQLSGYRCAKDANNQNTGYRERGETDQEACSSTYGQVRWIVDSYSPGNCPLPCPPTCTGVDKKCVNGICETGIAIEISCEWDAGTGKYFHYYAYQFSDGSWSTYTWHTINPTPCPID